MKEKDLTKPINYQIINNTKFRNLSSNSIDILFNIKGETKLLINSIPYTMGLYDVVVSNPYESFEIEAKDSSLLLIRLNRSLLNLSEDLLNEKFICNSCDYKNKEKFHDLYLLIYSYLSNVESKTYLESLSISYSLINELDKSFKDLSENKRNNEFNSILDYIEINYDQDIMLKELAEEFHLTVPYLSKRFKEITGKTFNDYYNELRINHSNYDLYETSMPIIDIAVKHGFSNSQAYIRTFKKMYGILPKDARKKSKVNIIKDDPKSEMMFDSVIDELNNRILNAKTYKDVYISANYIQNPIFNANPISNQMIGIGGAKTLLYRNVQDMLKGIQNNIHFKYGHIRGILSNDFSFANRQPDGSLDFRFNLIDAVLDFLDSINMYPALDFVFTSTAIASNLDKTIYFDGYNASLPKNLSEWRLALQTFLDHVILRYGIDNVKNWIFIPWSQPDSSPDQLGFEDPHEFYEYYVETYNAIKDVNKDFIVSSPELLPLTDSKLEYMKNFLNYSRENGCIPDILALMYYANEDIDTLTSKALRGKFLYSLQKTTFTSDPNRMNKYLISINYYLKKNNFKMPIYITSFGYTLTRIHEIQDTLFPANFVVKNYIDNMNLIYSYSYWHLTDFENISISSKLFYGGAGMFLSNGISKPVAECYEYLYKILDEVLAKGENYIITRDSKRKNHLFILIYNYEHPSNKDHINLDTNDKYSSFINKERNKIHLTITSLPYKGVYLREFSLNRYHGNPYDRWLLMGKPETQAYHKGVNVINNLLEASANPDYKELNLYIHNNIFTYEINVDPLEIKGIDIELKK